MNAVSAGFQRLRQGVMQFATRAAWGFSLLMGRTNINYRQAVGDPTQNSIVIAVVGWIARNFPEAPVRVRRLLPDGGAEVIMPGDVGPGYMLRLLERPNPYFSGVLMWQATVTDIYTTGNGYWMKIRNAYDRVIELWWVPSRMMRPLWPEDGSIFISGYAYRIDGVDYLVEQSNVVHFRDGIDPTNPRLGLSKLASLFREIYTDDEASNFTAVLLTNLGVPGVVIAPSNTGGAAQRADPETVKTAFMDKFGGDHRGEPLIFSAPTDIKVLSFSPDQMKLKELRRIPEERISAVLGVPASVAGLGAGLDQNAFCLPAEARVWTREGPVRIDEVRAGDAVWSFDTGRLVIRPVFRAGLTGYQPIFRMRTKNRVLRATGNHPVLARVAGQSQGANADRQPTYEWRRMDALAVGDYVVQPKSLPDLGGETLPTGEPAVPEMLKFMGAVLGDGTVVTDPRAFRVQIAMPIDDRAGDYYRALAARLFTKQSRQTGGDATFQAAMPRSPVTVYEQPRVFAFASAQASRWLADLGFGGRAKTKRVPGWVYGLRRDLRLAFLAGLVDTDGYIGKRGNLEFTFANRELTTDVKDLLLSVGIISSNVRHKVIQAAQLPNPGSFETYDAWFISASSAFAVSEIPFADPLYRERVDANLTSWKSSGFDAHKAGLSSDLGFYQVLAIDVGEPEPIYDLEIEDSHSFIADGVVVHNTSYGEARKAAYQEAVIPLQRVIAAELEVQLLVDFADIDNDPLDVDFDTAKASALQEALDAVWKRMESAATKGLLTRGEFKQATGQAVSPDDDVYIYPSNYLIIPAGEPAPMPMMKSSSGQAGGSFPPAQGLLEAPPVMALLGPGGEVRCSNCDKLLAEQATAPYRFTCARCKSITEALAAA